MVGAEPISCQQVGAWMTRGRLRLLFLLPFSPHSDATHGGARVMAQLLARMAARHHIALLHLRATTEPPVDKSLQEQCDLIEEVIRPEPGFSLREVCSRLKSALHGMPLWVIGSSVAKYSDRVRILSRLWKPDVVQVDYHVMGQYLPALNACPAPRLLVQHEPGASAARDLWRSGQGLSRAIRYLDMLAWERFERTIIGQVQAIVAFTERDRQALAQYGQQIPITRIPLGTELPEVPLNPRGNEPLSLLFVGNFTHPPNLDAAERLINAIFPLVQVHVPNLFLYIVGDQPTDRLKKMANEHIVVTGRVPDVMPYLDRAAVVVLPLRMGGGMRVKVLEALAAGKAVVASQLAVEGLDVADGKEILLADSDKQMSDAIVQLLANPEKRTSLAAHARDWACANLSWEKSISAYEALYESLIQC